MKNRVIILDPDCRNAKSHNLTASYRAALAAKAAGYEVDAIVNRSFPSSDKTLDDVCASVSRDWPTFAFNDEDEAEVRNLVPFHPVYDGEYSRWEKYFYALLDLHEREKIDHNTLLFMHTTSAPALMGMLQYLLSLPVSKRPKFFCLLYCVHEIIQGPQIDGVPNLEVLKRLRDEGLIGQNVFCHVETKGLQAHYAEYGFDFPIAMGPLAPVAPQRSPKTPDTPHVVAFFGEARAEKGFHLLPEIIEAYQSLPHKLNVEFRIQTYSNPSNDTPQIRMAKARLRNLQSAGLNIVLLGDLPLEFFKAEISRADLVLMPYDARDYQARGSGVAYDSIIARARVVCTPGTDIERTFSTLGVSSPASASPEDFAVEVLRALTHSDAPDLSSLNRYSIDAFFSTLLDLHQIDTLTTPADPYQARCLNAVVLPVQGGHGFVERAQLQVLDKLRVQTCLLGIPWVNGLDGLSYFSGEFLKYYFESPETRRTSVVFPRIRDVEELNRLIKLYKSGKINFYSQSSFLDAVERYVDVGPILEKLLAIAPVNTGVFNYSWLAPMIDKIARVNGGQPLTSVCEVHDYQSHQNVLRRKSYAETHSLRWLDSTISEDFEVETTIEAGSVSAFDHKVFISDTLKSQLSTEGQPNTHVIFPPNALLQPQPEPDIEAMVLHEFEHKSHNLPVGQAFDVDILFVGSAHPANHASLVYFLEEILPLILSEQPGVRLYVVGSIDRLFSSQEKSEYTDKGCVFVGPVADIEQWYAAAKVIALVLSEGTGFPTKVIEAMSLGKSFAANKRALYEIQQIARTRFPVSDTPAEMAEDILVLLSSRGRREKRGQAGRALYDDLFSMSVYARKWAQVLNVTHTFDLHEYPRQHAEFPLRIGSDGQSHLAPVAKTDARPEVTLRAIAQSASQITAPKPLAGIWKITEINTERQYRFINLLVSMFQTENGLHLSDFHIKIVRDGERIALEMRENDGAFQLLDARSQFQIDKDNWGRVVRIYIDQAPPYIQTSPILDVFLGQLPLGFRSCSQDDMEEWHQAALSLSKLSSTPTL